MQTSVDEWKYFYLIPEKVICGPSLLLLQFTLQYYIDVQLVQLKE